MIARRWTARNPARYLAPVALWRRSWGRYLIVHDNVSAKLARRRSLARERSTTGHARQGRDAAASYTVQPGDTLTRISAKTGVSIATLESLNPTSTRTPCRPGSGSGCGR